MRRQSLYETCPTHCWQSIHSSRSSEWHQSSFTTKWSLTCWHNAFQLWQQLLEEPVDAASAVAVMWMQKLLGTRLWLKLWLCGDWESSYGMDTALTMVILSTDHPISKDVGHLPAGFWLSEFLYHLLVFCNGFQEDCVDFPYIYLYHCGQWKTTWHWSLFFSLWGRVFNIFIQSTINHLLLYILWYSNLFT